MWKKLGLLLAALAACVLLFTALVDTDVFFAEGHVRNVEVSDEVFAIDSQDGNLETFVLTHAEGHHGIKRVEDGTSVRTLEVELTNRFSRIRFARFEYTWQVEP